MTIAKVYKQYKHLDILLSDHQWTGNDPRAQCLYDLWQAVKEEALHSKSLEDTE